MTPFILDSNFFIQAHRSNYPFDVVPSFWNKVKQLAEQGLIISIDKVRDEFFKNDDELTSWCKDNLPANFFKDSSVAINNYTVLASWANSKSDHYKHNAIDEFLDTDEADAWLIAYAMNQNTTLLTHEKSDPMRKSKIKMPDVCIDHGVHYVPTLDMFRSLSVTF